MFKTELRHIIDEFKEAFFNGIVTKSLTYLRHFNDGFESKNYTINDRTETY